MARATHHFFLAISTVGYTVHMLAEDWVRVLPGHPWAITILRGCTRVSRAFHARECAHLYG